MMNKAVLILAGGILVSIDVQAVTITHGSSSVDMAFVDIGHAENTADPLTGYGAADYDYRIGKYEVTVAQWLGTDPPPATDRFGNTIPHPPPTDDPLNSSSWYRGARFANWLTTGSYENGAYQFNASGQLTNVMTRTEMLADGGIFYVLPTEDEWYKAAYLKKRWQRLSPLRHRRCSSGSGYGCQLCRRSLQRALDRRHRNCREQRDVRYGW